MSEIDFKYKKLPLDDDCLPEEGKEYIFLAYAQPDGALLVSGPNSNVMVDDSVSNTGAVVEKYRDAAGQDAQRETC